MTLKQKNNLIAEIIALLEKSIIVDEENPQAAGMYCSK